MLKIIAVSGSEALSFEIDNHVYNTYTYIYFIRSVEVKMLGVYKVLLLLFSVYASIHHMHG